MIMLKKVTYVTLIYLSITNKSFNKFSLNLDDPNVLFESNFPKTKIDSIELKNKTILIKVFFFCHFLAIR